MPEWHSAAARISGIANAAPEPFWMPFDPSTYELGDILADAQIARIGRAWKLPILLNKRMKRIKRFFSS